MFFFKSNLKKPLRAGLVYQRVSVILLCLFTVFLFVSCNTEPGDVNSNGSFVPVGDWKDGYGGGYKITNSSLEYYTADMEWEGTMYPGENTKGIIAEANNFSSNAGVLLVQVTSSNVSGITPGKFIGVYYKDYTASHVFLANAVDKSYNPIIKNTLIEARNTFTVDTVETHVTHWGSGYTK